MARTLEKGQVLYLKLRFDNLGNMSSTSKVFHPYIIYDFIEVNGKRSIQLIQLDSLSQDRMYLLYSDEQDKIIVMNTMPDESVIRHHSYAQLNNTYTVEQFKGISKYLISTEKLSREKRNGIFNRYRDFHASNTIPDERIVHTTKGELIELNPRTYNEVMGIKAG